ncbi:MAG TPA: hypothetical protein VFZ98_10420, partial [Vicinamibacterales bacterium]
DTTDAATEHIASVKTLKKYFASYTHITDRTPEILSGLDSLEEVTINTCVGVTDVGIRTLARLPRLRAVNVSGMPHVTTAVTAFFGPDVRVRYEP